MTDEVKDMISRALRDEPPIGVDYDTVVAAGRRRRTRRQLGIVGSAALGVAAVVGSAVLVGGLNGSQSLTPATTGPTTSSTPPAPPGCAVPARTGGFSDDPPGTASPEELAESGRLTQAFARFAFPLPAGVTMDPAQPKLCAIRYSWGTQLTLHSPAGDRSVFIEVRPRGSAPADLCPAPTGRVRCSITKLADDTAVQITEEPGPSSTMPVIVSATAWRADGTLVRVMETGSEAPKPTPRILDEEALTTIASAPELKVVWSGPVTPPDASQRRAAELTGSIRKIPMLPNGVIRPDVSFRVNQGGYKLNTDISDAAGTSNLFINLSPPVADASVDCRGQAGCELIFMPDGRKATVARSSDGPIQRIALSTLAADGTQVSIMTSNQSEQAQNQGKTVATRPTPALSVDDLIHIATLPWLRW